MARPPLFPCLGLYIFVVSSLVAWAKARVRTKERTSLHMWTKGEVLAITIDHDPEHIFAKEYLNLSAGIELNIFEDVDRPGMFDVLSGAYSPPKTVEQRQFLKHTFNSWANGQYAPYELDKFYKVKTMVTEEFDTEREHILAHLEQQMATRREMSRTRILPVKKGDRIILYDNFDVFGYAPG